MSQPAQTPCPTCKGTQRIQLFFNHSFVPCDCVSQPAPEPEAEADDLAMITINGESFEISNTRDLGNGGVEIETDGGDFIVFPTQEDAGKAARAYWHDMATNDPGYFQNFVGPSTLTAWALGQYAGPGSSQVSSLEEWLDLHLDVPEEHFASYDSQERECDGVNDLAEEEIGFRPDVAYRSN